MARETKKEFQLRVEEEWKDRYPQNNLKPGNKDYLLAHNSFFLGAMVGSNTDIPYWGICIISGRDIIETTKEVKNG